MIEISVIGTIALAIVIGLMVQKIAGSFAVELSALGLGVIIGLTFCFTPLVEPYNSVEEISLSLLPVVVATAIFIGANLGGYRHPGLRTKFISE